MRSYGHHNKHKNLNIFRNGGKTMQQRQNIKRLSLLLAITLVISLIDLLFSNEQISAYAKYDKGAVHISGQENNQPFAEATVYDSHIVFDGVHHKLYYPVYKMNDEHYVALPDLQALLNLDITLTGDDASIYYPNGQVTLSYQDQTIINHLNQSIKKKQYIKYSGIIYLPASHIEESFGVDVRDLWTDQTKTVELLSKEEQTKETINQGIGKTIYVNGSVDTRAYAEPADGAYLGSYVIQDEFIQADMKTFNDLMGKQHASFFRYVGYGQPFPTEWVEEVKAQGGFPQIAFEPNGGLNQVQDDHYLRSFAWAAREAGVPILLRYASEMNGTWTAYSGDPELYIEKWQLLHDVFEAEAPNVMMLWNVFTMPEATIDMYYPGDDYVDYVGVNIYNVFYHNNRLSDQSDYEDPLRLLDYVYNRFSHKKPIVIGEFGATNYTVTDNQNHINFAIEKIRRMYKHLPVLYPRVKFIYYFDVNNLVNAPEGRKINNYAITENPYITEAYREFTTNNAWYLTQATSSSDLSETYSYRDYLFYDRGKLFVDQAFFTDYLNMTVERKQNHYVVTYQGQPVTVQSSKLTINKPAFFGKRQLIGLPVEEILTFFNIDYTESDNALTIHLNH